MTPVATTTTFNDFGLNDDLLKSIGVLGFVEPTPVQAKVIPILLNGERDLVALAQTGTGKTAAFGLPILQLTDPKKRAIQALVLCPTRELCLQITKDLASYGKFAPHLKTLAVYGGSSIRDQMISLNHGVHILVATPGRLNDLLRRGSAKLGEVARVVLDEADEMLSMGFQDELESILKEVPKTARTLLFSATMPSAVASMARKYMHDPEEVVLGPRNSGAKNVTHECYMVHARDRYGALKRIIDSSPEFFGIIFCRTRMETQEVADALARDRYSSAALHGDLSQEQRDRVMRNFREKKLQILVATDVASRGLDVNDLTHVVNFDLPSDSDVYTHRSGRTGRAGKSGVSIVLAHMREGWRIRAIEQVMKKQFVYKPVPSARQVCEVKLVQVLENIKTAAAAGTKLDSFMSQINEVLGDLTREDLLKLLVQRDFGYIVDYYQKAPEIHAQMHPVHEERNRVKETRSFSSAPAFAPRVEYNIDMSSVRVSLGRREGLNPAFLISLINRATKGAKLKLGRIQILDHETLFEIAAAGAGKMVANLNQALFNEKPVKAVFEGKPPAARAESQAPHPKYRFKKQ